MALSKIPGAVEKDHGPPPHDWPFEIPNWASHHWDRMYRSFRELPNLSITNNTANFSDDTFEIFTRSALERSLIESLQFKNNPEQIKFINDLVIYYKVEFTVLGRQYARDSLLLQRESYSDEVKREEARKLLDDSYRERYIDTKKTFMDHVFKAAIAEMLATLGISPDQHAGLVAEFSTRLAAAVKGSPEIPLQQSKLAVKLPVVAPELYRNRPIINHDTGERENIEQFLNRVYAEEIKAGILTEPALSRLDKTAYNVLRANKASFPDLKIPNKQELMKRDELDPEQIRQAQRVMQRSYREQAGQKPPSVRGR
jgi:hypothetical protein